KYASHYEQYSVQFCHGQETNQPVDRPTSASHRRFRLDQVSHRQGNGHQRERPGAVLQRASWALDGSLERLGRVPATENHAGPEVPQERRVTYGKRRQRSGRPKANPVRGPRRKPEDDPAGQVRPQERRGHRPARRSLAGGENRWAVRTEAYGRLA